MGSWAILLSMGIGIIFAALFAKYYQLCTNNLECEGVVYCDDHCMMVV